LNAEQEPEMPYWPKDDPVFAKVYNPRGVIYSYADGKIEDTGPLNIKRMETIDDETSNAAMDFMDRQVKAGKTVLLLDELYKDARLYPCAA
jgi:arylsulfatase